MKFTLVSTLFNEASRLHRAIDDLKNQTLQPDEIILVDGGSKDDTIKILTEWKTSSKVPIVLIESPGCNVAEGRNLAIRAAANDIILSTDFGCRFSPNWMQSMIAPFQDSQVKTVGGSFTVMESEQISLSAKAMYILSNGYNIPATSPGFIPSSRSIAYRKEVYDKIGGYREWLTLAGDDLLFGKELLAAGYSFFIVPEPLVFWDRHQTAKGFKKEAFRYGLGDGEANLNRERYSGFQMAMFARASFVFLMVLLTVLVLCGIPFSKWWFLLPLICLLGFREQASFFKKWLRRRSPKYNFGVFFNGLFLIEGVRLNYIKGYRKGIRNSKARTEANGIQKDPEHPGKLAIVAEKKAQL